MHKKAMHLTTNKCAFYHLKYFWSTFLREFTCVRTGICVIPVAGSKKCAKWNWKGGTGAGGGGGVELAVSCS
jgi:hypothetical protein